MQIVSFSIVALMLIELLSASQPVQVTNNERTIHTGLSGGQLTVLMEPSAITGSAPQGASRIPFATLNLSASCDADIPVESIDISHVGLGSTDDIAALYAVDGFTRVTRASHFDGRRRIATLRFRKLVVPRCSAVELSILGDLSPNATVASEHAVTLAAPSDIHAGASSVTLRTGDATRRVVPVPLSLGTLSSRMLPVSKRVRYGHIETVARIQLSSSTKSAHVLKQIRFHNDGDARDMDLQWLSLETLSGTGLTFTLPRMRGYDAVLDFNPSFILSAGQTVVLNLKATVRGSLSKKIDFTIEEPSDIVAAPFQER
jgi:hypothetical protein